MEVNKGGIRSELRAASCERRFDLGKLFFCDLGYEELFVGFRPRVATSEPVDFMSCQCPCLEVFTSHILGSARFGVRWAAPVQHEDTHRFSTVSPVYQITAKKIYLSIDPHCKSKVITSSSRRSPRRARRAG